MRRWARCVLGRHPLVRRVDRVEALLIGLVVLAAVAALPACVWLGEATQSGRPQVNAPHTVAAVALTNSVAQPGKFANVASVRARWSDDAAVHVGQVRVDRPLAVGDRFDLDVDVHGEPVAGTTAPPVAAQSVAVAGGSWLLFAAACAASSVVVGRVASARRHRAWDRALLALVADDDGWANRGA
jgi:hypothetical protein